MYDEFFEGRTFDMSLNVGNRNLWIKVLGVLFLLFFFYCFGLMSGFYRFFPVPLIVEFKETLKDVDEEFSLPIDFQVEDTNNANLHILGDSISLGYTPHIQNLLRGKVDVFRIEHNTRHTQFGFRVINSYFGKTSKACDVVTFNFGLWDIALVLEAFGDEGFQLSTIDEYETNLEKIVNLLKARCEQLVFITTTPVPSNELNRNNKDVLAYNAVAKKIMKENDVFVIDLYEFSIDKGIIEYDVHFKKNQYNELAKFIVEQLEISSPHFQN